MALPTASSAASSLLPWRWRCWGGSREAAPEPRPWIRAAPAAASASRSSPPLGAAACRAGRGGGRQEGWINTQYSRRQEVAAEPSRPQQQQAGSPQQPHGSPLFNSPVPGCLPAQLTLGGGGTEKPAAMLPTSGCSRVPKVAAAATAAASCCSSSSVAASSHSVFPHSPPLTAPPTALH